MDQGTTDSPDSGEPISVKRKSGRGWRFWVIFVCLAFTAFLSALEGSIVSTALPSISRALHASEDYIWVVNVYYLTSAAVQPIYGQLADIWGRRWLMIGAVAIFTLGSGICGGSTSTNMLIGGRTVQGLGAAGINMLIELIVCDLLPLRERGQFFGILFLFIILGSVLGPFLGGILVDQVSWRWAFYINLPFGGASLILLYFVLHVQHTPQGSLADQLKKIDIFGNLLLAASVSSALYALTYGGTRYPWSNAGIIVSLVLGLLGHGLFILFEASPLCRFPVMPLALFKNRTSTAAFIATFLQTIVSFWALYFLPLYFQSVQLVSPTRSGVLILPFSILYTLSALAGGGLATKLGRFRVIHFVGFAIMTIGIGTFTLFDRNTHLAVIAVLQLIFAFGVGIVTPSLLTAIQAALPDDLNAASTGTFAFLRSIGTIWGVSIPAAIFNNRFDQLLGGLPDEAARAALSRGHAYESASAEFVNSFPDAIRDSIISIYERSLMQVWQIGIVFAGLGFLVVFLEKNLELRTEHESQNFGLKDKPQDTEKAPPQTPLAQ
ncbi:putative major facilitator superfamily protein [Rosellinia necatrix]|uniref:Putative major facilitator superfamily protein n=1 Tax=Rosellinia necatrix TaxID=77044 RepID=A0A1W2TQY5_ROSNE|nr:putative major facilitator superfamily protein [Rosellinia necatrix]